MDWLQNLLFDENSIAHIVLLYSFVIAVGVLLGKIKFFGVSLGVTFVLFTGIVCGHFGLTGNTQILTFLQDFGLILFVFCIGLQVGPSFFSSFKKLAIAAFSAFSSVCSAASVAQRCTKYSISA